METSVFKYTDADIDTVWNNAITEAIRIVNAHSKTGVHSTKPLDWDKLHGMLAEHQRVPLINALKAIKK